MFGIYNESSENGQVLHEWSNHSQENSNDE